MVLLNDNAMKPVLHNSNYDHTYSLIITSAQVATFQNRTTIPVIIFKTSLELH